MLEWKIEKAQKNDCDDSSRPIENDIIALE